MNDNTQGHVRGVSALYKHPSYSGHKYDVAVLTLDRAVVGIEPIKPADETQDRFEEPGRSLIIAGWGDIDNWLQKANVPVVSDRQAEAAYALPGGGSSFVPPIMVAAGNGRRDTCYEDSGGPLFERNDAGRFIQVRITSFGRRCASPDYPGVYAEVNEDSIRSFILEKANS